MRGQGRLLQPRLRSEERRIDERRANDRRRRGASRRHSDGVSTACEPRSWTVTGVLIGLGIIGALFLSELLGDCRGSDCCDPCTAIHLQLLLPLRRAQPWCRAGIPGVEGVGLQTRSGIQSASPIECTRTVDADFCPPIALISKGPISAAAPSTSCERRRTEKSGAKAAPFFLC